MSKTQLSSVMSVERISIEKPHTSFATKPEWLSSFPPLGILHKLRISPSSREREAETQDYHIVSIQRVDLKCSFKNAAFLFEFDFFCTGVYFGVSHGV